MSRTVFLPSSTVFATQICIFFGIVKGLHESLYFSIPSWVKGPQPSCFANSLNSLELNGVRCRSQFSSELDMWRRCASNSPCWSGIQLMVQTLSLGIWFFCQSGRDCSVHLGTVHHDQLILCPETGYLDWFYSVSFRSYLALLTLVNSCVDHAVHRWEPIFFSQHFSLSVLGCVLV